MSKSNKKPMMEMGDIPSPLEAVDAAADVVNQVFCTPFRVVRNMAQGVANLAGNLERDISTPRESGETPPPPDKLIKPVFDGIGHIVGGVVDIAKGAVDGVVETGRGVQHEIDQFTP